MRMRNLTAALVASLVLAAAALHGCNRDTGLNTTATTTDPDAGTPAPTTQGAVTPSFTLNTNATADSFVDVPGPIKPDRIYAKCVQTITGFNHPAACTLSLDGKYLFVSNSAATLNGMAYSQGAISKLEILPDGRLKMLNPTFVDHLHAPMGLAVLPKATAKYPAGSLFVSMGMSNACDERGDRITEIKKFNIGVGIFDPDKGNFIGFIPMGPERALSKVLNHPVLAPSGLCFDNDATLYVADAGNTGRELDPQVVGQPGIIGIRHAGIDALTENQVKGDPMFLLVRHIPATVYYSKIDDGLYWTTRDDTPAAGVYRTEKKMFPQTTMVQNVVGDLGALMGVAITPKGTLIASRLDGDLSFMTKKVLDQVSFNESGSFSSPGDFRMVTHPAGYNLLYIPEQEPNAPDPWKQRLRVIVLPSQF
jgi:hypothetical protein